MDSQSKIFSVYGEGSSKMKGNFIFLQLFIQEKHVYPIN